MKYTAKARMLSYDFPNDDALMGLGVYDVLTLSFMICRADHLGRLPGEPTPLLYYLFSPKSPRPDFDELVIERALTSLSLAKIVRWYRVAGVRYVELKNWAGHQYLHKQIAKSSMPSPDDGVDVVVGESVPSASGETARDSREFPGNSPGISGGSSEKNWREVEVEVEVEERREESLSRSNERGTESSTETGDPRALIGAVASAKKITGRVSSPEPDMRETLAKTWTWVEENVSKPEQGETMSFAAWLFKSGTENGDSILALVKHAIVHRPLNRHAYYANTGAAREAIVTRVASDKQIAEHERIKREEREFLGGKR